MENKSKFLRVTAFTMAMVTGASAIGGLAAKSDTESKADTTPNATMDQGSSVQTPADLNTLNDTVLKSGEAQSVSFDTKYDIDKDVRVNLSMDTQEIIESYGQPYEDSYYKTLADMNPDSKEYGRAYMNTADHMNPKTWDSAVSSTKVHTLNSMERSGEQAVKVDYQRLQDTFNVMASAIPKSLQKEAAMDCVKPAGTSAMTCKVSVPKV